MRILSIALIVLFGCSSEEPPAVNIQFDPVKVKTATAIPKSRSGELTVTGVVTEGNKISAPVEGIVAEIFYQNGMQVSLGDTLALIRSDDVNLRKALADARFYRAKLNHKSEILGFPSADSIQKFLPYSTGLKEAEIIKDHVQNEYSRRYLISDYAGVLTDWYLFTGMKVTRGMVLGKLTPTQRGFIKAYFLEHEWRRITTGMKARIKLADGRNAKASLISINPAIDNMGRFATYWRMDNRTAVPEGMSVEIIPDIGGKPAIVIPVDAVGSVSGEPVVFTVVSDTARWNKVELRWFSEDSVEVVSGINSGDRVVLTYHVAIHEGTPVETF